jgi:hypothetical protein
VDVDRPEELASRRPQSCGEGERGVHLRGGGAGHTAGGSCALQRPASAPYYSDNSTLGIVRSYLESSPSSSSMGARSWLVRAR